MSDPTLIHPLRFDPSFEHPEKGEDHEAQTAAELSKVMVDMASTMAEHTGHAMRAVHAKGHGLLRGKLQVVEGLPEQLAQGVFAKPGAYDVLLRFSSPPAEQLPDNVSTPRGLAMKLLGVDGPRVFGAEGQTTQDFLMVNGPVFNAPGPKGFLKNAKLLAKTTDKAPGAKEVLSAVLRGAEKVIEAVGGESGTLKAMGGHPETHPLGETFFTQVPVLYGPYIAKFSLAPVSPALTVLKDQPLDMKDRPDALRDSISDFFASGVGPAEWELRVQLCTDIEKMPIEDASVEWPEELSPYITVARLDIRQQSTWNPDQTPLAEDELSFNPWHALEAHRPLGAIMRARRTVYADSVAHRSQYNGCPMHEPTSASQAVHV
ncbi:MAG: catalase family protein [Polaromonas sp.]|nr:catalase family protein [Polaromonas sp.]